MELRFTPTEEDARDLSRINLIPGWYTFLSLLLLLLSFLVAVHLIQHGIAIAGWVWLVLTVVLAGAMYEVPRFQAHRAFRHSPSVQGEFVYTVNEHGVTATFPTGTSHLQWNAFVNYRETARFFLVFTSPYRYWWIPKRAISPEVASELHRILKTHVTSES
ncbi:MAG: YcxB family protein [Candidatus Korobacteraceae bacterium]|jgi:hypothetical protein